MVERWKLEQKRALENLAGYVEMLAKELKRYNDLKEQELEQDE